MTPDSLRPFAGQKYLNLETYRRSGQAMPTPVWFVEDGGRLYVRTLATSGKVKRVRNNPRVRVAPCGMRGELKGGWVEARAALVKEDARVKHITGQVARKYGLMQKLIDLFGRPKPRSYAIIEIDLAAQ